MSEIKTLLRPFISLLLICVGVGLAHNTWGLASKLILWATRNPATIAFTTFAREHFPENLFRFEQDCLAHLPLAPYFFVAGVIAGISLVMRFNVLGIFVTLSYATWFSAQIFQMASAFDLHWSDFLPHLVWSLALTPIYLFAALLGRAARIRVRPHWRIRDFLISTAILAALMASIVARIELAISVAVLAFACFVTWVTWTAFPSEPESNPLTQPTGT
ncbi:hypothetical protein [Rosistilla oblonga]|uniref:hypothetical protein n=1 Tax=Rosistilla oblonga TaxID=2527990 RepID=UPI0011A07C75|nr:hypothetical protein [Rosistilla oblonga]